MANGSSRSRGRRGGVKRPAAVSGPGRLARRTDGQAPSIEDVRGMINESAGEESALVEQVRQGNVEQQPATVAAPAEQPQQQLLSPIAEGVADIFAQGDGTPITTASSMQEQESTMLEPDDLMLIRAMAKIKPSQELISLLQFAEQSINRTPQQFG
jgi:hypothetical protein